MNYREIALSIIIDIMEEGKYSHIVINQKLSKNSDLEKQDRAMISKICLGTIENCIAIDYEIERYSKIKVNKMKPLIRNLLRMSVYQIIYLDSIPDFAVCSEAVNLVKKRKLNGLAGFVNGILRNIVRNKESFLMIADSASESYRLSIEYSMPEWIIKDWTLRYSYDTVLAILKAFQKEKPLSIRINKSRISKEGLIRLLSNEAVRTEEADLLDDVLYLYDFDSIDRLESFQKGYYQVQDKSSVLTCMAAGIKAGDYIIDICAAPGGKSIHAADLLCISEAEPEEAHKKQSGSVHFKGFVSARDITEGKVRLMKSNFERCRFTNIEAVIADAHCLRDEDIEKADIVLADLPCSGLGIIGRKPDIKYKMNKEKQSELKELQKRILGTACRYVKKGGTLIYSTCTINVDENENNYKFIIDELGFEAESLNPYIPKELYSDTSDKGFLQIIPDISGFDGFFISRARKL